MSANAEQVELLVSEDRRLTAEIEQRQARRTTVRQTLERVRLVLAGQQSLPIESCAPEVAAPKPATTRKLRPQQLAVMRLAAPGGWAPQDRGVRITCASLEKAGLLEYTLRGEVVALTPAGKDLLAELDEAPK